MSSVTTVYSMAVRVRAPVEQGLACGDSVGCLLLLCPGAQG